MSEDKTTRATVDGGFFWIHGPAAVSFEGVDEPIIRDCVFATRPHPWQILRWLQLFRLWLDLPHLPPGSPYRQIVLVNDSSVTITDFDGGPPDGRYGVGSGTVEVGPFGQRRVDE